MLGLGDAEHVLKERKTYDFTDYADEEMSVTANSVSGTTIVLASTAGVSVGDLYYESSAKYSKIISVSSNEIEVIDDRSYSAGAAQVFKRIEAEVEWNPATGENPGISKQWQDVVLMFKDLGFTTAEVGFRSEISAGVTVTELTGNPESGWGLSGWGNGPWGGGATTKNLRTWVAKEKNICAQLSLRFGHDCAYTKFSLSGVSLMYRPIGERVTR